MRDVPIRVRPSTGQNGASSAQESVSPEDQVTGASGGGASVTEAITESATSEEELEMWRDRALRLQAELENYRKRQRRLAEEQIATDRERLLRAFLGIADDLARALNAYEAEVTSLRQGVAMTYRNLKRLLDREGVQAIDAQGAPFDPAWHEAVSTVSHRDAGVAPQTVVDVVQEGYRIGDRVLRPSRVVVAV
jgi:molecular chaperone GrpE